MEFEISWRILFLVCRVWSEVLVVREVLLGCVDNIVKIRSTSNRTYKFDNYRTFFSSITINEC